MTVYNWNGNSFERYIFDCLLWDETRNAIPKHGAGFQKQNAITVYVKTKPGLKINANGKSRIIKGANDYILTEANLKEFITSNESYVISKVDMKDFGNLQHMVIGID